MSTETDLVRDYFKAFNAHDLEGVIACFTDDAVLQLSDGVRYAGADAVRRVYERWFYVFPDAHCELTSACGSGGKAAAESVFTGTHRERDDPVRLVGAELMTLDGGMISELREYQADGGPA